MNRRQVLALGLGAGAASVAQGASTIRGYTEYLSVQAEDVIVVKLTGALSPLQNQALYESLSRVFKTNKIVILPPGVDISTFPTFRCV